jgi:hypothetical protein
MPSHILVMRDATPHEMTVNRFAQDLNTVKTSYGKSLNSRWVVLGSTFELAKQS